MLFYVVCAIFLAILLVFLLGWRVIRANRRSRADRYKNTWQKSLAFLNQENSNREAYQKQLSVLMRRDIEDVKLFLDSEDGRTARSILDAAGKNILLGCFGGCDRVLFGGRGLYRCSGTQDFVFELPTSIGVEEAVGFIYNRTPEDIKHYGSVLNKIRTEVDKFTLQCV